MPRKPRLHSPGAVYHVILRGNAGHNIFRDDKDRYRFYDILGKAWERFGFRLHAFCLMSNHVHLEIQVGEVSLSPIMQNISLRYTKWFNWRYKKSGHVFQGRYKAVMVDADSYLLELAAYIHLNPARARMVNEPAAYQWSSHCAYIGKQFLPWLHTEFVLSLFSRQEKKAWGAFAQFVQERAGEGRRGEFHGEKGGDSRIFGEDDFVASVLVEAEALPQQRPGVDAVVAAVEKLYGMSRERLSASGRERVGCEARGLAAWATIEISSGKLTELAKILGRDASTLTCAVRRVERLREADPVFAEKMDRLRRELTMSSYQVLVSRQYPAG